MNSHFKLGSAIGETGLKTRKDHTRTELYNYSEISLTGSIFNETHGSHKFSKK